MTQEEIFKSIKNIQFIDRNKISPNGYNPNKVSKRNLELLKESILANGFCFPIVIRPDMTIIDGFHRWMVSGTEPIKTLTGGKVPVVIVYHKEHAQDVYATITFNRARGEHLLEPMKKIVQDLINEGKNTNEIAKALGMTKEEIFRLSNFSRDDFLNLMAASANYGEAYLIKRG